jgi:hypothetical protein
MVPAILNIHVLLHIFGSLTRVSRGVGKTSKCMVLSKCFSPTEIYVDLGLKCLQKCKCVFVFSFGDLFKQICNVLSVYQSGQYKI